MTRRLTLVILGTVAATLLFAGVGTLALARLGARDQTTRDLRTQAADIAGGIQSAVASLGRPMPVLAVFMSTPDYTTLLRGGGGRIPAYPFPEDAARALGHAHRYVTWKHAPHEPPPQLSGTDPHRAAAVISATLAHGPGWLQPAAVNALLGCYGLTPAESLLVASGAAQTAPRPHRLGTQREDDPGSKMLAHFPSPATGAESGSGATAFAAALLRSAGSRRSATSSGRYSRRRSCARSVHSE